MPSSSFDFSKKRPLPWLIGFFALIGLVAANASWLLPLLVVAVVLYAIWKAQQSGAIRGIPSMEVGGASLLAFGRGFRWAVVAVLMLFSIYKSIVVVGAGETGVVHLFGKVRDAELASGFHIINPLARVEKMSVRTQEFSMTKAREGGQGDAIAVLTKEGLDVTLDITILYRLAESKASDVFKEFGPWYEQTLIRPVIRSAIRQVIAEFEAKDIYSERRQEVVAQLRTVLTQEFEHRGIVLEEVLLRDVQLPEKLTQSIQEKLTSEQEAQRYTFYLQTAKSEAERKRIEAAGIRDSQRIIGESLTANYLNYLYLNELKDRQGTIYVPTNPQNGLPLFQNIGR